MTLAQERAEASERRALRKLDAERTARQQSERTAEALRGELVAARSEIQQRNPAPGLIVHSDRGSQGGFDRSSQHP